MGNVAAIKHKIHHGFNEGVEGLATVARYTRKSFDSFNNFKAINNVAFSSLDVASRLTPQGTVAASIIIGAKNVADAGKKWQSFAQIWMRIGEWATPAERKKHTEHLCKFASAIFLTGSAAFEHALFMVDLGQFAAKQTGNAQIFGGILQVRVGGMALKEVLKFTKDKLALAGFAFSIANSAFFDKSSFLAYFQAKRRGDVTKLREMNVTKTALDTAANTAKCVCVLLGGPEIGLGIAITLLGANLVVYARCLHSIYEKEKEEKINQAYNQAIGGLIKHGVNNEKVKTLLPLIRENVEQKHKIKPAEMTNLLNKALKAPCNEVDHKLGEVIQKLQARG